MDNIGFQTTALTKKMKTSEVLLHAYSDALWLLESGDESPVWQRTDYEERSPERAG